MQISICYFILFNATFDSSDIPDTLFKNRKKREKHSLQCVIMYILISIIEKEEELICHKSPICIYSNLKKKIR
jgi:hypothetical protein